VEFVNFKKKRKERERIEIKKNKKGEEEIVKIDNCDK
jgi:hypothetical protein